ncbi:MAG: hypothetical protein IPJ40_12165 [Saprospirales bacterium]|nr:hypothetical protein [Saprospirales bacterium]
MKRIRKTRRQGHCSAQTSASSASRPGEPTHHPHLSKHGRETQYEICHDVLALVVGAEFNQGDAVARKSWSVYQVYEGSKVTLLPRTWTISVPTSIKALPRHCRRRWRRVAYNARKDVEKLEEAQRQAEQERELREAEAKEKQSDGADAVGCRHFYCGIGFGE